MIERGKKIYLCRPDLSIVTILNGIQIDSVSFETHVKDYTTLSFTVDKYIRTGDTEIMSSGYDLLDVYLYLYLEDDGYYQMQHPKTVNDGETETKQVIAYSVEKEWEQKKWVGLKVNTGEKDSLEALVDGNLDALGYAKDYIVFYNPNKPELSLLHILLTKMPGWSVINDDIDPLLWSKRIRIDEDNTSLYALLTNVIAPKMDCLIMFDRMNRRIKAFSRFNLESYHYNTNIFIGYRNLADQIDINVNEDSVFTRFNVEGGEKLNFRDVNYNDSQICDYGYFMHEPYMKESLVSKMEAWIEWRDENRETFANYSVQQKKLNDQIYDVRYKVPDYEIDWTQWDDKTTELLQENLDYYNAVLTSLQVSVDPDPQYDASGNYIPWKKNGKVDHDRYLEALYEQDNGFGGYYTYYEVLNYIIPNIEIAMQNASSSTRTDYITTYETDWTLYGIEELENKRRNYESQLEMLADYSKPWAQLTTEEKKLYINDENMYNSNGRTKYVEIKGYLGSTSTSGTLLYQLNKLKQQLSSLQSQLDSVTTSRTNMVEAAQLSNSRWGLTTDELKTIETLTIDTTYTNSNIFTTDLDTAETTIDREMELYNDAVEKLSEVSQPQFSFSVSLDNLLRIPEFADWVKDFKLLNYFRLGVQDRYSVKLRMVGYSYNPCEITPDLNIEFSNMISSRSGRTDLTNLINDSKGGSTGGSISSNSSASTDKEYLATLLTALTRSSTFRDSVSGIAGSFVANNATLDTATIAALSAGYISASTIDVDQVFAHEIDVWNLLSEVGMIGEVISEQGHFTSYLNAVNVDAANITAGTIVADRIAIRGSTSSLVYALNNHGELTETEVDRLNGNNLLYNSVNADRIVAHSITVDQITTNNLRGTHGWINLANGTFKFYTAGDGGTGSDNYKTLSWDGSALTVNGNIYATGGNIGGFTITNNNRANSLTFEKIIGSDRYIGVLRTLGGASSQLSGSVRMFEIVKDVGNVEDYHSQFYVGNDGYLYAANATISGLISANNGKIWLKSSGIYTGTVAEPTIQSITYTYEGYTVTSYSMESGKCSFMRPDGTAVFLSTAGGTVIDGQTVSIGKRLIVGSDNLSNYIYASAGDNNQMMMLLHSTSGMAGIRATSGSDQIGAENRSGAFVVNGSGTIGLYNYSTNKWIICDTTANGVTLPNPVLVSGRMTFSAAPVTNNNYYYCSKNTDGDVVPVIGWSSGNNMWVGHYTFANRSNRINLGATIDKLYVYNSSGSTVLLSTQVSDRRLKHDISDLQGAHDLIMSLRAKEFRYNGETEDRKHYGFIAQDVRPLIAEDSAILAYNPIDIETGEYDADDESTFEYSMSYTELIAPHIAVTQEHENKIAQLEAEIDELKEIIRKMTK